MLVYLAGCKGDWREKYIKKFPKWTLIDPFIASPQEAICKFTSADLNYVANCDMIIMNIIQEEHSGSLIEAGAAYAWEKPIILIWQVKGRLDSMLLGISKYVFNDEEAVMQFIADRFYGKEGLDLAS